MKRADLVVFEWQSASHGDLYGVPPSGPQMSGFVYENNQLTVKVENIGACTAWRVTGPDGLDIIHQGRYPTFPIIKGQHEYTVRPTDCADGPVLEEMTFDLLRVPQGEVTNQIVTQDVVRMMNMPLVFSLRPGPGFERWVPPAEDFGEQDVQRARDFLAEHGIVDSMSSLEKVARISHALASTLLSGQPPEYLNHLSPMSVLDEALSGRARVFCRQRALTQVFLSNVAGVPSRIVWSGRILDGVMLSGHGFMESYITEQARWAYSDISHGISYITDRDGHVLNAADVLSVISNHAGQGLQAWSSDSAIPAAKPWTEVQELLERWYNKNATLTFWSGHDRAMQQIELPLLKKVQYRVQRYLFEPSLYFGYQNSYNLHWLRGGLILLSIVSGLMVLPLVWPRKK
ncbi:hypothetical protein ACFL12_04910 [Pseudomonadota bacterium]